jgi:ABC-type nickel/cobalt efflux system permease component RcnA
LYTPGVLILTVFVVGVLHTLVPDHWAPITLIARQRGWTIRQTARAAAGAGLGHVVSTLIIAAIVWVAGVAFAQRFGNLVDILTSLALTAFGGWVAIGALREVREEQNAHAHPHHGDGEHEPHEPGSLQHEHHHHSHESVAQRHTHLHKHGDVIHSHFHAHTDDAHDIVDDPALDPPAHVHEHSTSSRTAMLLILGSSPMVEGIPAFFAASRYGIGVIATMSIVFAISTIATYVVLCVTSVRGMQRLSFGPIEEYGEVISGSIIALLGIVFLFVR